MLFGFGQFVVHGIVTNLKLKSFYTPGLPTVALGHIPLGSWYLVQAYQQGLITGWDWLFPVLYMAFFIGVIMMRIGYGLLSPRNSKHPFATPASPSGEIPAGNGA